MTMLPAWVTVRVAEEVVPVTVVAEKVPVPELDVSTVKAAGLLEPPLVTLTVIVSPGEKVKVVPVGRGKGERLRSRQGEAGHRCGSFATVGGIGDSQVCV
jgi:hypothetical protein